MNETLKTIADRRSIRDYKPSPVPEADLQAILTAALQSPSAMDEQFWHFTAVSNAGLLAEFEAAQTMMPGMLRGAPTVVFITAPKLPQKMDTPENAYQHGRNNGVNCGIAVQNIALAAWSLGYGSVILGMPRAVFEGEKGSYFKEKFAIPTGHEFIISIGLGKATKSKDAHELHPEKITIIR